MFTQVVSFAELVELIVGLNILACNTCIVVQLRLGWRRLKQAASLFRAVGAGK